MPQLTSNAAILSAAKRAIEVLLQFKGSQVILVPKNGTVVAKPSGGRDFVPAAPRAAQTVVISRIGSENIGQANTDDGQYVTRAYTLTGRWNMAIAIGDTWSDGEADYTVDSVDQTSGFKTSADVLGFVKIVDPLGISP